jgi:hypothetical protein
MISGQLRTLEAAKSGMPSPAVRGTAPAPRASPPMRRHEPEPAIGGVDWLSFLGGVLLTALLVVAFLLVRHFVFSDA